MDNQIKNILKDLQSIDKTINASDTRLEKTVRALVATRPEAPLSDTFKTRLRTELMAVARSKAESPYKQLLSSRFVYGMAGSIMTILVVVPLTYVATRLGITPPSSEPKISDEVKNISSTLSLKQQISNKGNNAFGTVAAIPITNPAQSAAVVSTTSQKVATGTPETTATTTVALKYLYKGDAVTLGEGEGTVFKRIKGIDSGKQLAELIQGTKFSLADLKTFSSFGLRSIELSENKPFGYTVSVNIDEGMISINPNQAQWKQKEASKSTTTPTISDTTAITIANTFIRDHDIDTTIYGKPLIAADKKGTTTVVVVYPMSIQGLPVYDEHGKPYGLEVTVGASEQKVISVTNLNSQTYESSSYKLEQDFTNVLTSIGATTTPSKSLTATLGTPSRILVRSVSYDAQGANELYMPALLFTVTKDGVQKPLVVPRVRLSL